MTSLKELYELLTSQGTEVTNLIYAKDDVEWVCWKYSEDNKTAGKKINVAVAANIKTQDQLKIYGYLSEVCYI